MGRGIGDQNMRIRGTFSVESRQQSQLGLSLIELMIALVVGLLLLGGLIQIYLSNKQSYNAQEQLARMQESGRFSMDIITRDLRRAGFWGGNVDILANGGNPGPAPPQHSCTIDDRWGRMIGWRVSGLNNTNAGYATCTTNYIPGTDLLTIRYAGPETISGALAANGLFLRSTMFLGRVMTGALAAEPENQAPPDPTFAPGHLAPVVRSLVSHGYYIGNSARTCPGGEVIPALRRIRLDAQTGTPVSEEIASGVEQLQVRYLLDDTYLDADAIPLDQWRFVRAVRVWLLVRGDCPEQGLVNDTNYVMGDLATWPTDAPDNFRRQLYVSTVMLRNTAVR